jgi:hypothetical protein
MVVHGFSPIVGKDGKVAVSALDVGGLLVV